MPRSRAAATSIAALRGPVVTSSRRSGNRSSTDRGNAVRSRMATTTSKPRSDADQLVRVVDVVGERDDLDAGGPVDDRRRDVLVVVEHRDPGHGASRRLMSSRSSPLAILPPEARGRSSTTTRCSGQVSFDTPRSARWAVSSSRVSVGVAGTQDDVRADPLAEQLVGRRDRGDQGDRGVAADLVLDLRRADVLAAADDEVGRPADDREVAVVVDPHDVADEHPAVRRVQLGVGRRIVEVAAGQQRALAPRLAVAEQPHVHRLDDPARRAQPVLAVVPGGRAAERAGLVRTVELEHERAGALLELGGPALGHRLAAGEHDPQRR